MAEQQQAPTAPQVIQSPVVSMMESIIDSTVRSQYEQAVADRYMAQTYAKGANVSEDEARTIIALGRDYGWGAAHSLQRIFIERRSQKPCLYAEARSNMLRKAGYSWTPVVHNDKECTYQFARNGEWMQDADGKPLRLSMTMERAIKAGWVANSRGDKKEGNYDKVPEDMLFARMITRFHRYHAADVDGTTLGDPGDVLERVVEVTEQQIKAKTDDAVEELSARLKEATA